MYKVVSKRFLNEAKTICLFEIEAPLVARHAQVQFVPVAELDDTERGAGGYGHTGVK